MKIDYYFLIKTTSKTKANLYKMAELMVMMAIGGVGTISYGLYKANKKKPDSYFETKHGYRGRLRASAAKAYAYQQSLIIEAEMREEAMNKLSIYEQEVIKEIELELQLDNLKKLEIGAKMEADEAEIRRMRYRNFMENTPEYKEMLKKYPEYKKSKN